MNIVHTIANAKKKEIQNMPAIDTKTLKKSEYDFMSAVQKKGIFCELIAEIKPASPIGGRILPADFSVSHLAKIFEKNGAAALSILTDEKFFQGSFENLKKARAAVSIPLLCKDFIISKKQIHIARQNGADSFLLIAQILESDEIQMFLHEGRKWNMEALVEIADENDLQKTLSTDAKLIGINNRDLKDFSVQIGRTFSLAKKLPAKSIVCSLSGFSGSDTRLVRAVADAVLVGTKIGKAEKKGEKIAALKYPAPMLKCCGVRSISDAKKAETVDFLGLNFVPTSRRKINDEVAAEIATLKKRPMSVGIFQNQSRVECERICQKYSLDFCQLSGEENANEFQDFPVPIWKSIALSAKKNSEKMMREWEKVADIWLFDAPCPGSGKRFDPMLLPKSKKPFFVAGGISPENAKEIRKCFSPDGIDVASGIEKMGGGEWDAEKITKIKTACAKFSLLF